MSGSCAMWEIGSELLLLSASILLGWLVTRLCCSASVRERVGGEPVASALERRPSGRAAAAAVVESYGLFGASGAWPSKLHDVAGAPLGPLDSVPIAKSAADEESLASTMCASDVDISDLDGSVAEEDC